MHRYFRRDVLNGTTGDWERKRTISGPLDDSLVMPFMSGRCPYSLSFFVSGESRDYIGIDIDDHECGGWAGDQANTLLTEKFHCLTRELGVMPSMVFRSPRGLHAFWFLNKAVSNITIQTVLGPRVSAKLGLEILPTERRSLTIPRPLDYVTNWLIPSAFPGYDTVRRYDPEDILGNDYATITVHGVAPDTTRNKSRGTIRKPVEAEEAAFIPLKNHHSNDAYKHLVGVYFARGLSIDEAYYRFKALVEKSPGYSGRLLTEGLKERIASSYKNLRSTTSIANMPDKAALRRDPAVAAFIDKCLKVAGIDKPSRIRIKNSLEDFILNLICWIRSLDEVMKARDSAAFWGCKYPEFPARYQEGYYPLPFTLLHKWNSHYDRPMRILKEIGALTAYPFSYSTVLKRCKYYRLNFNLSDKAV
jgi:hypothetical protein